MGLLATWRHMKPKTWQAPKHFHRKRSWCCCAFQGKQDESNTSTQRHVTGWLLQTSHSIIESTRSNLFLVSNRVLYTPGLDSGPIGGVMRAAVINLALEEGFKVYECNISPGEMLRADELFLTNAVRGIQWVASYRTKRYFNMTSKSLIESLNSRLIA